tara:strand:+ start:108 stop:335 length:228 start_codon:yes stop_codon:yes gene_type:complete
MEPDARISAGIQKRARNLAAEELLIEVMAVKGEGISAKQGLRISIADIFKIKSSFYYCCSVEVGLSRSGVKKQFY